MPMKGNQMQTVAPNVKPHQQQPLQVLYVDDALLKIDTVRAVTGLSRTTIYTRMSENPPTFPQAIRQGKRCTRWRAGDIRAFLQSLTK
jgi:prophage regulatory protein